MPESVPASDPLVDPPAWAPSWLPSARDERRIRYFRWVITAVFVAGLSGCVLRGADEPADPYTTDQIRPIEGATPDEGASGAGDPAPGSLADRFGTVLATIASATGELLELCLLDADEAAERNRGLMQVTDLEGYDGMVFTNDTAGSPSFYMYNTLVPLTLAWWDDAGDYLGATDMDPCPASDPSDCTLYPPPAPFRFGLEVVEGHRAAGWFATGARLELGSQGCRPRPA